MQLNNDKNGSPLKVVKNGLRNVLKLPISNNRRIEVHSQIKSCKAILEKHEGDYSVFLSTKFFQALEDATIHGIEGHQFILIYKQDELLGFIVLQFVRFDAKENLKSDKQGVFTNMIKKLVHSNGVTVGNLLVSGNYSFVYFDHISPIEQVKTTDEIVTIYLAHHNEYADNLVKFTFLKDYIQDKRVDSYIRKNKYNEILAEPILKLDIRKNWKVLDDYLNDMSSKYRVRCRRARKKFDGLIVEELTLARIIHFENEIVDLYSNILAHVDFSMFELTASYFVSLKRNLGNDFKLFGYFDTNNKLVGFNTVIHNREELHAHFLGYHDDYNNEHQLYLNMLYNIVEYGISNNFESIDFGRTASAIKSSIGAEPYALPSYLKMDNFILNVLACPVIKQLNPEKEWIQRHPFKD